MDLTRLPAFIVRKKFTVLANYLDVPGVGGYAEIDGSCRVGAEDSSCTFTNIGTAPGSWCVDVKP